jgi:hypothetical protein
MGFFNTAPPDQQLHELPPNSDILLENLHPDHALLRTRLPNVAPQVFVERSDGEKRREIDATISGLWIDTRRSVATLTFHCQVPIEAPDEPGKVWVAVAGPGRRLTASQLGKLIGSLRSSSDGELDDDDTEGDEVLNRTVSIRAKDGKIRRPARGREDTQTSVLSGDARREALAKQRDADAARRREDTDSHVAKHHDGLPEWVARGQKSAPPPPPTRARKAGARPPWPGSGLADTSSLPSHAVHAAAPISGDVGPPSSGGSVASRGSNVHVAPRMEPPASVAIMRHVAPATTVAATSALPNHAPPNHAPPKHAPTEVVELLWFDEEASGRLRRRYSRLADELEFAERDARHDLDRDDPRGRDHHLHFGMLTALAVQDTSGMRLALREAVSETGRFTPPLVVLRGKLRFPFEPLEILRATAAVVTPVAGDDKKLKSALDQVKELLETPLLSGSAETVTNFVSHLRKLYRESRRALSLDYLDETVDRTLLEQRKYDKRTLFGGNWIRALLSLDERDKGVPIYLPEELDKSLPMMTSFNARLIAEAHVRQDQFETHPHALKVVTLGRIVDFNDP